MKKKGFTLIELLAVIIILGILMLIAIPSVTTYINNSRKETYASTIKELIKGASNILNSGEVEAYDTETTYYIPTSAIKLESGEAQSPYGKFTDSYIVATFDGEEYDYYYVGKDTSDMGISSITRSDLISKDLINTVGDIDTSIGLEDTRYIVVFKDDLTIEKTITPSNTVYGDESVPRVCPSEITETIYWALQDKDGDDINEVLVLSDHEVDGNLKGSFSSDTVFEYISETPWVKYSDNYDSRNLSYNVSKVIIDGILVPKSMKNWFHNVGAGAQTFYANLRNIYTCHVTDMSGTFGCLGQGASDFKLKGIEDWDTSHVTKMNTTFTIAGYNAEHFKIDVSKWDVSNVTNMDSMFSSSGYYSKSWSVGDISKWDVSNVTDMSHIFSYAGYKAESFHLDISGWNMSKVSNASNMFYFNGNNTSDFEILIPKTNGNGIDNLTNKMYGKTDSVIIYPPGYKSFTIKE